ncbi:MAG: Amt family ammonium transporter [Acidimicrobiales bacterium]|jgi:ammonium transporter, Amt family
MDSGNTAWILTSAALVLFMVPGLALFYGGMSRSKNMLNMLMMNMVCLGIVPIFWYVIGYSLSSTGTDNGWIGTLDNMFLADINITGEDGGAGLRDVFFALTFACITPALISGAVADRLKFSAWLAFVPIWMLLVFTPAWAWVFKTEGSGWLAARGSLDFAGGTVVHVAAGAASMAFVVALGKRRGWPTEPMLPHNLPFTMLGAGILWFGWFGFNAGSAFAADGVAIQAFANTFMAAAAAMLSWLLVERIVDGHATSLGAASGIVAGLVGITPGAGFMGVNGAIGVGLAAGALCALAVRMKFKFGYDDALDVVGVHLVGGLVGGLLIGVFASPSALGGDFDGGLIEGDGAGLLLEQIFANAVVGVFAFVMTFIIVKGLDATIGLRVSEDDERVGLDTTQHAETAYN